MVLGVVIWGATAIAAAVLAGLLAGFKNRDVSGWAAWCFLIPPLVLVLLLLPKHEGPRYHRPSLDEEDATDRT